MYPRPMMKAVSPRYTAHVAMCPACGVSEMRMASLMYTSGLTRTRAFSQGIGVSFAHG